MNKCYYRIVWEDYSSDKTPLNAQNLNRMDSAIDEMDNRIISLDSAKFDKSEAQMLVKYIEYDESTGIFRITHYNGASYTIDTLLEKLAINFDYDYQTQRLIIELSDGTVKYVDLSALITQYEFLESDTVHFIISADGKVKAEVKEGSIQEKHLRPDYLADIKVEAAKAESSKNAAAISEANAKKSENAAKLSEEAAKMSEDNSAASKASAEKSAKQASDAAKEAQREASAAINASTNASLSAADASASAADAAQSADTAAAESENASESASTAAEKAGEASGYADASKSYAVGGTGTRDGEDTDNSRYYSEQARISAEKAEEIAGGKFVLISEKGSPGGVATLDDSGRVPKAQLPEDIGSVTGVKGSTENAYRTGNVNLTPQDIGAFPHTRLPDDTDLNTIVAPGVYYAYTDTNSTFTYQTLIVFETDKGWITQIAIEEDDNFDIAMRYRTGSDMTWSDWENTSRYFVPRSEKGATNGVATLGADRKIPNAQLPAVADMCVSRLGNGGNANMPMTFHYVGKPGQPQWVWGSDEGSGTNSYVWNPAAFSVAYANTAHGIRAYNEKGVSYGESWVMKCKYNMYTDGAFGLYAQHNGGGIMDVRVARAAMDAYGRDIASTYLPVTGGDITGMIRMNNNPIILSHDTSESYIRGVNSGDIRISSNVAGGYELIFQNVTGGDSGGVWHAIQFFPSGNGNCALGVSSNRWMQLYAATSTISTSDRNLKQDIKALTPKHLEFFLKLQPVSFAFIDGSSGRTHIGFISQDVESAMAECGLTALDFAGFCKDIKTFRKSVTNEDGTQTEMEEQELDEDGNPIYIYSLRYEEFIALNTYAIQTAMARLDSLEERMKNIEGSIRE